MKTKRHDSGFQKVLEAERLTDLSQFYQDGLCDEVPLYSRYDQVSFLSGGWKEASAALLTLGLNFLENFLEDVIRKAACKSPFFVALTVWEEEGQEPIVPNVFVCNGDPNDQLMKLSLHKPKSSFSKKIEELLSQISMEDKYLVLEDDQTLENRIRVFIGQKTPPYPQFVPLASLLKK
jgi:hypothetical protein